MFPNQQASRAVVATAFSVLACTAALASTAAPVLIGPTAAAKPIGLAFYLPSRDPQGAHDFAIHVTKPHDALFHHFLTPAQFADRFGANPADVAAVVTWASQQGLTVGERSTAGTILPVTGPAEAMRAALGLTFNDYRDATGRLFSAADGAPRLPTNLQARIAGVVGLSAAAGYRPYVRKLPVGVHALSQGTGPGGAFSASDLRTIYDVPAQAFGPKQTLAVFEQGGFAASDVTTYLVRNKLPNVRVRDRNVNGYGGGIDDPGVELEAVLDIDMQIAMNPDAGQIIVYEDGADSFAVALLDSLSAMANDDLARSISISYGLDETLQGPTAITAENTVLTQMAAQGQAVFVSAGDDGAYGDGSLPQNVADPASQPFVTGVGGTTLLTGRHESYLTESVWNSLANPPPLDGGTGGGVSVTWPIPDYQTTFGITLGNGGSGTMRNVPDVAAVADPATGVAVYSALNGGWVQVGGTSVGAPMWAGVYSLVNAASEGLGIGPAGYANPELYGLGIFGGPLGSAFNYVQVGNNGNPNYFNGYTPGFSAGPGYDNCTGLGTISGEYLIADFVTGPTINSPTPPPAPNGLKSTATSDSITLTWTGAKVDTGYLVLGFNYATGVPATTTLLKKRSITITGLAPKTAYFIYAVAITPTGSAESAPVIVTTPAKA